MDYKSIFPEEYLRSALIKYFETDDFEIVWTKLMRASNDLIGFLAEHMRMRVQVRIKGAIKEVSLFIKMMPRNNKDHADYISQNNYYQKEKAMYDLLNNLPGHEEPSPWKLNILLKTDDLFVMEDMAKRGFKGGDNRKTMNIDQCYAVVESLARLHAAGYTYERQKTKENGVKFDITKEYPILAAPNNFTMIPALKGWVETGFKSLITLIGELSSKYGKHTQYFETIKNSFPDLYVQGCELLEKSDKYLNVLIHTDLWAGNFLMRTKHPSVSRPDVILVDFQCAKFAPGTIDIAAFLHLCTTRATRDEHEEDLLRYYRDVFNKHTIDPTNPRETVTWQEIRESYDENRLFGFISATILFPFVALPLDVADKIFLSSPELPNLLNVDRSEPMIECAKLDTLFRQRIIDITEEFIERYIINIS